MANNGETVKRRAKNSGIRPSVGMSAARGMEDTSSVGEMIRIPNNGNDSND